MLLLLTACSLFDDQPFRENVLRLTDADGDGVTLAEGDCNDADPGVYPGAEDVCDGDDNDCDGETDELPPETVWCQDVDGDGFGDVRYQTRTCYPSSGWVMDCTDCDDAAPLVHPDATEVCNGYDDDCDGVTDPAESVGATTWYVDRDADGYGGSDVYAVACEAPPGATDDRSDCDDADGETNPGASEVCGDGRDNDCDGTHNACGWSGERVLDTTMAAFIAGPEVADEYLGISLGIVDTNADGVDDIVLAGRGRETAPDAGAIHVWVGAPLGARTIDQASGHLRGVEDLWLGESSNLSPLLPISGSGFQDLLVAASGYAPEFDEDGVICRIPAGVYGDSTLDPATVFARGASYWEGFGEGFVRADSMTDGAASLLVAAPYNGDVAPEGGAVYLVRFDQPDAQDAVGRVLGSRESDSIGATGFAFADDLDGDGVGDLVVSSDSREPPALFVVRGPLIGELLVDDADLMVEGESLVPDPTQVAPDVNGDGYEDLVTTSLDQVVLLDGHATGRFTMDDLELGYLFDSRLDGATASFGLTLGDVHSDGVVDLVVGSRNATSEASDKAERVGALAIVPLDDDFEGGADLWDSAGAILLAPEPSGFGWRVALGDVNADGFEDLLMSATSWDGGGFPNSGAAWFLLGGGI